MEGLEGRLSENLLNIEESIENKKRDLTNSQNNLFKNFSQDSSFNNPVSQTSDFSYEFIPSDIKDLPHSQPESQPHSSEMDSLLLPNENVYQTLQPVQVFDFPTSSEPKVYQQLQSLSQKNVSMDYDHEHSAHPELSSVATKEVSPPFRKERAHSTLEPVSTSTSVQNITEIKHQITAPSPQQENKTQPLIPVGSLCRQLTPVGSSSIVQTNVGISPKIRPISNSHEPPVTSSKLYQQLCRPLMKLANTSSPLPSTSQVQSNHSANSTGGLSKIQQDTLRGSLSSYQSQDLHRHIPVQSSSSSVYMNSPPTTSIVVEKTNGNSSTFERKTSKGFPEHKPKVYLELREPKVKIDARMHVHSTKSDSGYEKNVLTSGQRSGTVLNQSPGKSTMNEFGTESVGYKSSNSFKLPCTKVSDASFVSAPNMGTFLNTSRLAQQSSENNSFMFIKPSIPSVKPSIGSLSLPRRPVCFGDSSFNNASRHSQVGLVENQSDVFGNQTQTVTSNALAAAVSTPAPKHSGESNSPSNSPPSVPKSTQPNNVMSKLPDTRDTFGTIRVVSNESTSPVYQKSIPKSNLLGPAKPTKLDGVSSSQNSPKPPLNYPVSKNLETSDFRNCFENFSIGNSLTKGSKSIKESGPNPGNNPETTDNIVKPIRDNKCIDTPKLNNEILTGEINNKLSERTKSVQNSSELKTSTNETLEEPKTNKSNVSSKLSVPLKEMSEAGLKNSLELNKVISNINNASPVDAPETSLTNQIKNNENQQKMDAKDNVKNIVEQTSCLDIAKNEVLVEKTPDGNEAANEKLQMSSQKEFNINTEHNVQQKEFVDEGPCTKGTKDIRSNLEVQSKLSENEQPAEELKQKYTKKHQHINNARLSRKQLAEDTETIMSKNLLYFKNKLKRNWKLHKGRRYAALNKDRVMKSIGEDHSKDNFKPNQDRKLLKIQPKQSQIPAESFLADHDNNQTTTVKTPVILLTDIGEECKNKSIIHSIEDSTPSNEGFFNKDLKPTQKWKPHKARRYLMNYVKPSTDDEDTVLSERIVTSTRKRGRPVKYALPQNDTYNDVTRIRKLGRPRKYALPQNNTYDDVTSIRKLGRPRKYALPQNDTYDDVTSIRKLGRPRKYTLPQNDTYDDVTSIRKLGRPRKYALPQNDTYDDVTSIRKLGRPRKYALPQNDTYDDVTSIRKLGRPRKYALPQNDTYDDVTSIRKLGRPRKYANNDVSSARKRGRPRKYALTTKLAYNDLPRSKQNFPSLKRSKNEMNVKTVGKPHKARKYAFIPTHKERELSEYTRKSDESDVEESDKEENITQYRTNENSIEPSRKSKRTIKRKSFYLPHEEDSRKKLHGNRKLKFKRRGRPPKSSVVEGVITKEKELITLLTVKHKRRGRPPKSSVVGLGFKVEEELIDPLEAGLISDGDDELFLGFVHDSTDEDVESNSTFKKLSMDTFTKKIVVKQECDSMTVECDPASVSLLDISVDSEEQLETHTASTSAAKPGKQFSCPVCHKFYSTSAYVKKHLETIHHQPTAEASSEPVQKNRDNSPLFQCDKCSKHFDKLAYLNRHKQTHVEEHVSFPCAYCDEKFPTKDLLRSHWAIHMESTYTCEDCNERFPAAEALKEHKLLLHEKLKPFRCEICQQSFTMLSTLKTHLLTHTGSKQFECKTCFKRYSRQDTLTLHQRVHTGEKNFECDICHEKFRWRHGVKSHKLIYHSSAKPYQCEVCKKQFSHPNSFKKHAEVHSEKVFNCEICFKPFSRMSSLKIHLLIHTDIKEFSCYICKKSFRIKGHLRTHLLVHTDEKPCKCKYCSKSFKSNHQLRRHNQLVHCNEIYEKIMPQLPESGQSTQYSDEEGEEEAADANHASDHFILSHIEGPPEVQESVLSPSYF